MTTITARKPLPAATLAAAWATIFAAFHLYWALGGRVGLGTLYNAAFRQTWFVTGDLLVVALCLLGAAMARATTQPWGRRLPTWLLTCGMCTATTLLIERGAFAVLQDALGHRLPTGLSTPLNQWSSVAIDVYFCLGGILFALAALPYFRRTGRTAFAITGAILGTAGIAALMLFS